MRSTDCASTGAGSAPGSTMKPAAFSDDEPALRQSTRTRSPSVAPRPVADFGQILEGLVDMEAVPRQHLVAIALEIVGTIGTPARPADRLLAEVKATHVVEHDHVERCGRGA